MLTLISPRGQLHRPLTVASLEIADQAHHPPPAVKRKIVWADAQIWGQLGGEILASGAPGDFSRSFDMPTPSPISTMRHLFWLRLRAKGPKPLQAPSCLRGSKSLFCLFAAKMLIPTNKNLLFRPKCGIMRCVIKDNATPKTGGVTSHAHPKRIARKACLHKFNPPVPPAGYPQPAPINPPTPHICKTNPIPAHFEPTTLPEGQSRFIGKPNSHKPTANRQRPTPQKCETNPIPPRSVRMQTNETNPILTHQVSHRPLFPRNEPNLRTTNHQLRTIYAKRTQFQHTQRPTAPYFCKTNPIYTATDLWKTKNAKRTQSTNHELPTTNQPPQLCETNPISAYPAPRRPLFLQNEPNSPPRPPDPQPKRAKRTQFYTSPSLATTQIRETNPITTRPTAKSKQPTAQKCKTNPIPAPPPSHHAGRRSVPARRGTQFTTHAAFPTFSSLLFSSLADNTPRHPIYPTASIPSIYNQQSPCTISTKWQKKVNLPFFSKSGISYAFLRPSLIVASAV